MPDREPELLAPVPPAAPMTAEALRRRKRGQNLAILLALVVWVVVIYIAIMVKVHNEIRP
jgi:hypothetical protein